MGGKKVLVALKFPLREQERDLIESTRGGLNINCNGKPVFSTYNFGQEATGMLAIYQKPTPFYIELGYNLNIKYKYETILNKKSDDKEFKITAPLNVTVDEACMEVNIINWIENS